MIQNIYFFLQSPNLLATANVKDSISNKVQTLFKIYLLYMGLLVLSVILILVTDWIVSGLINFSIRENLRLNQSYFHNYWKESAWILTVVLGPISEEIVFRLPLTNNKKLFALSIGFATFYFTGRTDILNIASISLSRVSISILVAFLCYFLLTDKMFLTFRSRFFNYMCWGLIIAFSWIHIGNFDPINWNVIYLYPIYVLPQLFYGIGASFLMIKYGNIIWPILLHILINGVPPLLGSIN